MSDLLTPVPGLTIRKGEQEANVHFVEDGIVYYAIYHRSREIPEEAFRCPVDQWQELAAGAMANGAEVVSGGKHDPRKFLGRRAWTPEEDSLLHKLRQEKLNNATIGKILDRPASSISSRFETLASHAAGVKRAILFTETPKSCSRTRPCLCCGKSFASDGPHNRLCSTCRTKSVSPYELYA